MCDNLELVTVKPGKSSIFQFCPYFSTCSSLESGTPTSTKVTFPKLVGQKLSCHRILFCKLQNCSFDKHFKMDSFLINDLHEHFDNKQLPWKQSKTYLTTFIFLETLKGTPNGLRSFEFLKSRVCEVQRGIWGWWDTLSTRRGYQKALVLEGLKLFPLEDFRCVRCIQSKIVRLSVRYCTVSARTK